MYNIFTIRFFLVFEHINKSQIHGSCPLRPDADGQMSCYRRGRTGHFLPPSPSTWHAMNFDTALLSSAWERTASSPALCSAHRRHLVGMCFFLPFYHRTMSSPYFYFIFTQQVLCVCGVWLREWVYMLSPRSPAWKGTQPLAGCF